ncbi:MAG: sodium-dependent transporter, partial [Pseudomonadota bacterium]
TTLIVAGGIERGLEKAVRVLMPALFVMQLILVVYAYRQGAWSEGVEFLFKPDWRALTGDSVLIAMGQAFFTLSIGMGAVMAYGAYLPQDTSILGTSVMVIVADTVVALLAGLIIFPIMFQYGLSPAEGEGLIFKTLPIAFGNMNGGVIFGTLFFLLLVLGAWTSAIGLLEPAVAWFIERLSLVRWKAAWLVGGGVWVLGLVSVFSFNLLADWQFFKGNWFDNVDYFSTNILLPVSGFFIAIFAGWKMCQNSSSEELDIGTAGLYRGWRLLIRWVAPIAVAVIFVRGMGWLG